MFEHAAEKEVLHADITLFRTADNTLAFIYFIQDNCSRAILQYQVASTKKAAILIGMLKNIYAQYFNSYSTSQPIVLADDGTENKRITKDFPDTSTPLLHLIAQKDIIFSNSIIEHLNKTIKYRYLYQLPIHHIDHLKQVLDRAVEDYNNGPAY